MSPKRPLAFMPGFLLRLLIFTCSLSLYKASVTFSNSHLVLPPFTETIDSSQTLISKVCCILHASTFLSSSSPYHVTTSESYNKVTMPPLAKSCLCTNDWVFFETWCPYLSPVFLDYCQYQLSQVGSFKSRDGSFGWKLLLPRGGGIGGWS